MEASWHPEYFIFLETKSYFIQAQNNGQCQNMNTDSKLDSNMTVLRRKISLVVMVF